MDNSNLKEKPLKIPYKFDSKCIIEDSIIRIFRPLTENKTIEQIITNTKLPYLFSETNNPIIFQYIMTEVTSNDSFKEITWFLRCDQIPTPIKITFNLTENTVENNVLVVFEISIIKRELTPEKYKKQIIDNFEDVAVEVLNNVIIKLKNDYKDIYHYESRIFNFSRDKLKNIILNLYEIMLEKGYISSLKREGNPFSEGEILNISMYDNRRILKLQLNKIKMDEKSLKWKINYMPLEMNFKDFLLEWIIVKVKSDETLVVINNIYSEQIEPKLRKGLTEKKKEIFDIIEDELRKRYPK